MSRITPHVPMTQLPLAGEAEIERMHAKLRAKVSGSSVEQQSARVAHNHEAEGANPSAATPLLKWDAQAPKARGYYSFCKRYSVASVTIAGHEYFEAFKLAKGGCWFTQIARGLKSFAEAEAVCEADAGKR